MVRLEASCAIPATRSGNFTATTTSQLVSPLTASSTSLAVSADYPFHCLFSYMCLRNLMISLSLVISSPFGIEDLRPVADGILNTRQHRHRLISAHPGSRPASHYITLTVGQCPTTAMRCLFFQRQRFQPVFQCTHFPALLPAPLYDAAARFRIGVHRGRSSAPDGSSR